MVNREHLVAYLNGQQAAQAAIEDELRRKLPTLTEEEALRIYADLQALALNPKPAWLERRIITELVQRRELFDRAGRHRSDSG